MATNGKLPIKQETLKLIVCLFIVNQVVAIQCSTLLQQPQGHSVHLNSLPHSSGNDTTLKGFKVIKEVTVEEIIDLGRSGMNTGGAKIDNGQRIVDLINTTRGTIQSPTEPVNAEGEFQHLENKPCLMNSSIHVNKISQREFENSSSSSPSDNHAPTSNVTKAPTEAAAAAVGSGDPVSSDTRQLKQLLAVAVGDDSDGDDEGDHHHHGHYGSSSSSRRRETYTISNQDGLNGRTRINLDSGDDVTSGGGFDAYTRAATTSNDQTRQLASLMAHHRKRDKIGLGVGDDRLERFHTLPSAQVGGSKVIFIPDRIILAEDIIQPSQSSNNHHHQKQQQQSNSELQLVVEANVAKHVVSNNKRFTNGHNQTGKLDSRCPRAGVGTLEHPGACDKYYYCQDGFISEQTCPNGLLYGTRDPIKDYCVYRWTTNCGDDKSIPNPISSPGCRWQYGLFSIQGSPKCSPSYYECADGKFTVRKCPLEDQVYDDRSKSCKPFGMVGCSDGAVENFQCPPDDQSNTYWPFPRYFLNGQTLIHCINQRPELVKCGNDERVDPEHLHCVPVVKRIYINNNKREPAPSDLAGKTDQSDGEPPLADEIPGEEKLA